MARTISSSSSSSTTTKTTATKTTATTAHTRSPPPTATTRPRPFFKTYDIRSTSNTSTKNIEIWKNGRPILWVVTKTKLLGSPLIQICKGGPDGVVLTAAKFKSIRSGFYIRMGNPEDVPTERWPQVTYSSWNEKEYFFEFEGRRYCWRSPVTGLISYLKDHGDHQLIDMETGSVLASYIKDRAWFAFKPIARIDFFVELGPGLELMALAAIMGVEERRRRKTAAATGSNGDF